MTAVSAFVATSEATTSTSFTDLATTTDTVTVTVGASGAVLVCIYGSMVNNTAGDVGFIGYALSGANTRAAEVPHSVWTTNYSTTTSNAFGASFLETGLTAGSTTFKMKYEASAATATFANRRIVVIPIEDLNPSSSAVAVYVAATESTTSTTYADLTTTTDTVTTTVGASGNVLVCTYAYMLPGASGYAGWVSYALSGANTRAADDPHAFSSISGGSSFSAGWGGVFLETGLAAGSTTFKMKYKGDGTTSYFAYRRIAVIPL